MIPLPDVDRRAKWPTEVWETAPLDERVDSSTLDALFTRAFDRPDELGETLALLVVQRGRIVAEAYGPAINADTTLISWSMAKSITHALVGIAVRQGLLDLHAPAPVPEWARADDPRHVITLDHLLHMRSGLAYREEYVDDSRSDVIEMLFGSGAHDMAAFAAAFPLDAAPGAVWSYSSGSTNIVSRIVGDAVGGTEDAMRAFMHDELLGPLGMRSAVPRFDAAGTFVGSSFFYATARDFARFGLLYLRDGVWDGRRILPEGWVGYARTPTFDPTPPDEPYGYGAHWWLWPDGRGTFAAHGYEGQLVALVPTLDLVLVRLGKTPEAAKPNLRALLADVIRAFDATAT